MRRLAILAAISILIIGAITISYFLGMSARTPQEFEWRHLTAKGYGSTSEAIFDSDIALPKIRKIEGKAKFLTPTNPVVDGLHLGYVVSVDVEKLNIERVPKKYKEEIKQKHKSGEWIIEPIQEVVYQVTFAFKLKDKDGFELLELKSPVHNLHSGKESRFQDKISESILNSVAERTKDVFVSMTVEKCLTCSQDR